MNHDKVFQESFKLWEQLAAGYANVVNQTLQQSFKQSEAFQEQVDEARDTLLKAWQMPFQPNQQELLQKLNELQTQVQALTRKVEQLEKKIAHEGK